MAAPPAKRRGCPGCAVIYSSLSGECPLCGQVGTENIRNWKGTMPPSRGERVWMPADVRKRIKKSEVV
jgi:hypothetical protein